MDQKQLDELITPQTEHPDLTVGKIYGALLMFEHWKAYKNRQQDDKDCFGVKTTQSRAESFASIVSVISQRMANTKSALSLRTGDIESVEQLNFVNSNAEDLLTAGRNLQKPPQLQKRQLQGLKISHHSFPAKKIIYKKY